MRTETHPAPVIRAQGTRPATVDAAEDRFRPFLRLEAGARSPLYIAGILQTWRQLQTAPDWPVWFERSVPFRFRMAFALQPGLEPYAVLHSGALPAPYRSASWNRLLAYRSGYQRLDLARKTFLLKLLGMLGFYKDMEALLEADTVSLKGKWSEAQANYAYLKALAPMMMYESALPSQYAPLLRVAAKSPEGSRIRCGAAVKFMVSVLQSSGTGSRAATIRSKEFAWDSLRSLKDRVPTPEFLIYASKYWRAVCYFPFYQRDHREVERQLDLAERTAREALNGAGSLFLEFADENLYAVLATRAVVHYERADFPKAESVLRELLRIDPSGGWQYLWLGKTLFRLGRFEEAKARLETAILLAPPDRYQATQWLARCLASLGSKEPARRRRQEARSLLKRLDELIPKFQSGRAGSRDGRVAPV